MRVIAWPAFKTAYKNPYTALLYDSMPLWVSVTEFSFWHFLSERFDVLHLHWPVETIVRRSNFCHALARVIGFLGIVLLCKLQKTKIVWTIHDEVPHSLMHPKLARFVSKVLEKHVDACIHLCLASIAITARRLPALAKKPLEVIPHGDYRSAYAKSSTREDSRRLLSLSSSHCPMLLFFGYVSPYKNVLSLINAFGQMKQHGLDQSMLMIAGRPDNDEVKESVIKAAAGVVGCKLSLSFVPDNDVQHFFKAADVVVTPFSQILNTGSLLLALSFDRPVIAPNIGGIPELQVRFGERWVRTYDGPLTAKKLALLVKRSVHEAEPPEFTSWDEIAGETAKLYEKICKAADENRSRNHV